MSELDNQYCDCGSPAIEYSNGKFYCWVHSPPPKPLTRTNIDILGKIQNLENRIQYLERQLRSMK